MWRKAKLTHIFVIFVSSYLRRFENQRQEKNVPKANVVICNSVLKISPANVRVNSFSADLNILLEVHKNKYMYINVTSYLKVLVIPK